MSKSKTWRKVWTPWSQGPPFLLSLRRVFLHTGAPTSESTVIRFSLRAVLWGHAFNLYLDLCFGNYWEQASFTMMKFKAVPVGHPVWYVGMADQWFQFQGLGASPLCLEQAVGGGWVWGLVLKLFTTGLGDEQRTEYRGAYPKYRKENNIACFFRDKLYDS